MSAGLSIFDESFYSTNFSRKNIRNAGGVLPFEGGLERQERRVVSWKWKWYRPFWGNPDGQLPLCLLHPSFYLSNFLFFSFSLFLFSFLYLFFNFSPFPLFSFSLFLFSIFVLNFSLFLFIVWTLRLLPLGLLLISDVLHLWNCLFLE